MGAENDHGHGRDERRTIKIVTLAGGLLFPHAAQAICVTRRTRKAVAGLAWLRWNRDRKAAADLGHLHSDGRCVLGLASTCSITTRNAVRNPLVRG